MAASYFRFKGLLQRASWLTPAFVGVDEKGAIIYLSEKPPTVGISFEGVDGYAIPGFQNAHSHAFQYAMAGLAECHPANTQDDFWSWREAMYQCALSVNPDQAEAIAAMVYSEMLRNGYTSVAEFHYLHHDKNGKPYSNLAEMGERMLSAARTAGIGITLVPVFYQKGNFGTAPFPHQRRFISPTTDNYFKLWEASNQAVKNSGFAQIGLSVHSLRAVSFEDVLRTFNEGPADLPFHLHVSEQKKEVSDCVAFCGKRPMQWLLEKLPVNSRFHLVHSTHLDDDELKRVASSGAHVVLCPSTEGNLGDGIFRMKDFVKAGGRWSIGTDSHIGLDPLEEFRMIDYRQRLLTNQRNTFDGEAGRVVIAEEIESGRKAMGVNAIDHFVVGQPFDAVVYDAGAPLLDATGPNNVLATLVYASGAARTIGTLVGGKWIVKNNRHVKSEKIKSDFAKVIRDLKNR